MLAESEISVPKGFRLKHAVKLSLKPQDANPRKKGLPQGTWANFSELERTWANFCQRSSSEPERTSSELLLIRANSCETSSEFWGDLFLAYFWQRTFVKKRLLQKSEGNFSEQSPGWILRGIFWWIFSGLFPWTKQEKKSTKKSTAKFKSEFGSFAAKIHTARIRPWTFVVLILSFFRIFPRILSHSLSHFQLKLSHWQPNLPKMAELSGPVQDTPPYRAIPFRDSIAEGGIAPICLVFAGYRASIAEIPLLRGGVSHLHFACSPRGKRWEKGEGVSHPIGHVETPKAP